MIKQRADLGFAAALNDLGDFDARTKPPAGLRPGKEEIAQVAMASGFQSREPKTPEPQKVQRRRRTGRNVQFNIKTTQETVAAFCRVADENGWGLGETLERAVALLQSGPKGRGDTGGLK